jgi:hypothetical protein
MPFLTNPEVIAVNQNSVDNRQVYKNDDYAIWIATEPGTNNRYAALFNLSDKEKTVSFNLELEHLRGKYSSRNLWQQKDESVVSGKLEAALKPHGAALFKLSPVK